jgi:hypothetical protein
MGDRTRQLAQPTQHSCFDIYFKDHLFQILFTY